MNTGHLPTQIHLVNLHMPGNIEYLRLCFRDACQCNIKPFSIDAEWKTTVSRCWQKLHDCSLLYKRNQEKIQKRQKVKARYHVRQTHFSARSTGGGVRDVPVRWPTAKADVSRPSARMRNANDDYRRTHT